MTAARADSLTPGTMPSVWAIRVCEANASQSKSSGARVLAALPLQVLAQSRVQGLQLQQLEGAGLGAGKADGWNATLGLGLADALWRYLPEPVRALHFPTGFHYDFRTPEYAQYDQIKPYKWESTRGVGHSFGNNRREGPDEDLGPFIERGDDRESANAPVRTSG